MELDIGTAGTDREKLERILVELEAMMSVDQRGCPKYIRLAPDVLAALVRALLELMPADESKAESGKPLSPNEIVGAVAQMSGETDEMRGEG